MITRRTALTIAGLAPAASLFGNVPEQMGQSVAKYINQMVSDSAREWVHMNTREYDPNGGMMGRGIWMQIDEMLLVVPALRDAGFVPFRLPACPLSYRITPVWGADGAMSSVVWHAFVREHEGKSEIVAFEHTHKHLTDFKSRTGLDLLQALEQA